MRGIAHVESDGRAQVHIGAIIREVRTTGQSTATGSVPDVVSSQRDISSLQRRVHPLRTVVAEVVSGPRGRDGDIVQLIKSGAYIDVHQDGPVVGRVQSVADTHGMIRSDGTRRGDPTGGQRVDIQGHARGERGGVKPAHHTEDGDVAFSVVRNVGGDDAEGRVDGSRGSVSKSEGGAVTLRTIDDDHSAISQRAASSIDRTDPVLLADLERRPGDVVVVRQRELVGIPEDQPCHLGGHGCRSGHLEVVGRERSGSGCEREGGRPGQGVGARPIGHLGVGAGSGGYGSRHIGSRESLRRGKRTWRDRHTIGSGATSTTENADAIIGSRSPGQDARSASRRHRSVSSNAGSGCASERAECGEISSLAVGTSHPQRAVSRGGVDDGNASVGRPHKRWRRDRNAFADQF
ncbi:MAG: hypothetical protein BWY85_00111 [Firmicutes bacterium ADurb.Bin506]|nr:MAG: hypothetical protein BWY85_00111 [Firmicutes bacterium ADurb.Bin506]